MHQAAASSGPSASSTVNPSGWVFRQWHGRCQNGCAERSSAWAHVIDKKLRASSELSSGWQKDHLAAASRSQDGPITRTGLGGHKRWHFSARQAGIRNWVGEFGPLDHFGHQCTSDDYPALCPLTTRLHSEGSLPAVSAHLFPLRHSTFLQDVLQLRSKRKLLVKASRPCCFPYTCGNALGNVLLSHSSTISLQCSVLKQRYDKTSSA